MGGDTEFFMGNPNKNKTINKRFYKVPASSEYSKDDKKYTERLLTCKEIGDLLQAYYGLDFITSNRANSNELALFTNDEVLTMRCQIMKLPVVYNVLRDYVNRYIYVSMQMESMTDAFRNMHVKNLHSANEYVIKNIQKCIERGYFLHINGKKIKFSIKSRVIPYLQGIIKEIRRVTALFDEYNALHSPHKHMTSEQFMRFTVPFYAVNIFNGAVLNTAARLLFLKPTNEIPLFARDVGRTIMNLVQGAQSGGGDESDDFDLKYDFSHLKTDYIELDETDKYEPGDHLWQYAPHTITQNRVYKILKARHPEKTTDVLRYMTEDVNNILYYYFTYIGGSSHSPDFLSEIVDRYENGTLGLMSYKEFDEWYSVFHKMDVLANIDSQIAEFVAYIAERNTLVVPPRSEYRLSPAVMAHGGRRRTRKNRRRTNK